MFNFKEKLNSFLDDLEEDETKKSEEEKKQEQATAQKSRQEELAKYLESLKQNKEAEEVSANVTLSNNPISSLEAPRMEFEELDESVKREFEERSSLVQEQIFQALAEIKVIEMNKTLRGFFIQ